MKPNFALSLSFDGIELLHRAAGGWRVVGHANPQEADLTQELDSLRAKALALEPGGLTTKLIIPNDQIKYMTIESTGLSPEARTQSARAALQGATPYDVSDLAFDTCVDGAKTHIAAVARQTLSEAETFANEHRFNPVSSVGVPGDQGFLGEPFFGPTLGAEDLLAPGEQVEPDGIAVVVIGDVAPPAPVAQPADEADTATPASQPEIAAEPAAKADKTAEQIEQENTDIQAAALDSFAPSSTPVETPPAVSGTNAPSVQIPDDDIPPAKGLTGFVSRRRSATAATETSAEATTTPEPTPAPSSAAPVPTPPPSIPPAPARPAPVVAEVPPLPAEAIPAKRTLLGRRREAVAVADIPAKPAATLTPGRTVIPADAPEAEKMTIFGARSGNQIGGKPRYLGLMLCAALLVFLVGVAAMASVFMDDGLNLSKLFGERSARVSASTPAATSDGQILPGAMPKPAEQTETIQTAALEAGLSDEDSAVLDALRTPVVTPPAPLTQEEIEAAYAVTGIWPVAPDVPPVPASLIEIDNLYLSRIKPANTQTDAVALPLIPDIARANPLPDTPLPPLPGQRYNLDAQGQVTPSIDGTLSPDGFTVFSGRPEVLPPENFLNRVAPEAVETPAAQPDPTLPNPLAELRPRPRPGNLAEDVERNQLGGLTRSELAEFRPTQRPASIQQQAEIARAAAEAARLAAEAGAEVTAEETSAAVAEALENDAAAAAVDPFASATRQASAQSLRPDPRPRNFAAIVKRSARSAPAATATEETRVAAVAPRTVSPKIPTKTSVARQATVKNALNLKRVNLIGVYGKPSSRRALIRLSNGRYRKVEVGDRIDGGRVSAIGDSELRYTKGGRNVVLKMPRG